MFSIEVKYGLRKWFIPQWTVWGVIYSSTADCRNFVSSSYSLWEFFYSSSHLCLKKLWCMELYFLILLIVFIHEVSNKISNSNIPDPKKHNRHFLARLWDVTKRRADGKCYYPCTQCRGFKRRRILISTATKHCKEHGHAGGGGNEYRPFVGLAL